MNELNTANELEIAKEMISNFCLREYGQKSDFTDLKEIPILYTTWGDDEMVEVQINVNLIDYEIVFLKRDARKNEEYYSVYKIDGYATLRELIEYGLKWMDFNDLYAEYEFEEE